MRNENLAKRRFFTHVCGRSRGYGRFRTQQGNGLGGILRKLFRSTVPFLIRGGREIGQQALKAGVNVGEDVLAGKNAKTAAQTRLKEAVGSITRECD